MNDLARLRATLGHPDLSWLVERIRQRLERGGDLRGAITLPDATLQQREAVDRLFGRRSSRGAALTVQLAALESTLRHAELCEDLRTAVEALTGTIVNRRNERVNLEQQWAHLFEDATHRVAPRQELQRWLEQLRTKGILRRLAHGNLVTARNLLDNAMKMVLQFPVHGVPLAEFAAGTAGDSHALDVGRPLGALVVRAAALIGGIDIPTNAEGRRDAWAGVGVLCDELSAPVLVLNLRGDARTMTGRALRLHAEHGEPYRLSIRQLLRDPPAFEIDTVGRVVHVCENPTVVAAAAYRLGARSVPIVCIEGQPKTAARLLLDQLAAANIELRYHGDFDWDGIRIANLVMKRHRALPWRFSTECYRAVFGGVPLKGSPVAASWDAGLLKEMTERNLAIHEELVLAELIHDLTSNCRVISHRGDGPLPQTNQKEMTR